MVFGVVAFDLLLVFLGNWSVEPVVEVAILVDVGPLSIKDSSWLIPQISDKHDVKSLVILGFLPALGV